MISTLKLEIRQNDSGDPAVKPGNDANKVAANQETARQAVYRANQSFNDGSASMTTTALAERYHAYLDCRNRQDWMDLGQFVVDDPPQRPAVRAKRPARPRSLRDPLLQPEGGMCVVIFRILCYRDGYAGIRRCRKRRDERFGLQPAARLRVLATGKGGRNFSPVNFARNPLKRLVSDERIQANPSFSKFGIKGLLGRASAARPIQENPNPARLTPPEQALDVGER